MCTPAQLHQMLNQFAEAAKSIYGEHLQSLTLFGSYARGDYDDESDIDIMVLVDIDKLKIKQYREQLVHVISEIELQSDLVLSPVVLNADEYNQFKDASGFLHNVEREGVSINF
jgi:uncharacterized protein